MYAEADKLRKSILPPFKKIKRVAIPAGLLSKKDQLFYYFFMKNLGIKVKLIKTKINSNNMKTSIANLINDSIKAMHSKASIILMPIIEKRDNIIENITLPDPAKDIVAKIKNIKLLKVNLAETNPHDFCVKFGLAMNMKLKTINKAYFDALEKAKMGMHEYSKN